MYLDSDILFFKHPAGIIQYIKDDKPFFNSDYQNAYANHVAEIYKAIGVKILPKVNAGMTCLRKGWFIDNADFIENYLDKGQGWRKGGNLNQHEQTLAALLLTKYNAMRLSENYQISSKPITDQTISHHFVIDGSRKNFFLHGMRYLRRNKFLQKYNRSS
jgi:hypothetical protein